MMQTFFKASPQDSRATKRPTSASPERSFPFGTGLSSAGRAKISLADREDGSVSVPHDPLLLGSILSGGRSGLRLPAQTRLRGMLETDMSAERIQRLSRLGKSVLAHTRGIDGDWSDSTQAQLDGLAQLLAEGRRLADLTQVLSDPRYLQRRLALGTYRRLIQDLDVCESALDNVVTRQASDSQSGVREEAALTRRLYLQALRSFVLLRGPALEGPERAKGLFLAMLHRRQQGGGVPGVVVPAAAMQIGASSVEAELSRLSAFVSCGRLVRCDKRFRNSRHSAI